MAKEKDDLMEKIVSLAKRRGFIYPGSEIYGGLSGTWDFGPLGVELKKNLKDLWWERFVRGREDIYGLDAAILMNEKVWKASGHTESFADPMVECKKCKKRHREDQIEDKCPECGGELGETTKFNMMFETKVGATEDARTSYLRPETAQGIFVNFKNVIDSFHPKLPFGIAQIGKAFRNEIAPRDFVFRSREFEQMEIEYFVEEKDWGDSFKEWQDEMAKWLEEIGISKESISVREHEKDELSHYSKKTIDFEYEFPFGTAELWGLAYRTDFDLKAHSKESGEELVWRDHEGNKTVPHVIEPTFGIERTVLAILSDAYREDPPEGEAGDERVWLKLSPKIAPYKVAVFPLLRNKEELVEKAREVYEMIRKEIPQTAWDDIGNVGKRYRRQDEIGTPYCITVDFDSLDDEAVTVRDRDSMEQERIEINSLADYLKKRIGH